MLSKINIKVDINNKHQRLDLFLMIVLNGLSRSFIQKLINKRYVMLYEQSLKSNYKLKGNEELTILIPMKHNKIQAENLNLNIIFMDDDIMIINKKAGMVIHPSVSHNYGTLSNALLYYAPKLKVNLYSRPGIVHRLDMNTSGLMICARNDFAYKKLISYFKNHKVKKEYHVFCFGYFKKDNFTLHTFHRRDDYNFRKFTTKVDADQIHLYKRNAISHFSVIQQCCGISELLVDLVTGKTHQIRVQLSDIGHPVLGDYIYGNKSSINKIMNFNIKNKILQLTRHALHSSKIEFIHPRTNEKIQFMSNLPNDLLNLHKLIFQ